MEKINTFLHLTSIYYKFCFSQISIIHFWSETIVNCFAKAGISKEKQSEALLDAEDPFKDLQEELDKLSVHAPHFFPEGTCANDVVSADDSVINTEPILTDDELFSEFFEE